MDLKQHIRNVPDFPKPGIQFKDITTLLQQPDAFQYCIAELARVSLPYNIDLICGVESRGFILGAALAYRMQKAFIPIRKPGKLPAHTIGVDYQLEYGSDRLEIHSDAIAPQQKVLLIDDLLATGGTLLAATQLIERLQGKLAACAVVIDLPDLGGRQKLEAAGYPVLSLLSYDGH